MLSIPGIYTGREIRPLEPIRSRPNQRVIITFLDEDAPMSTAGSPRVPGSAHGQIVMSDDFALPLPDDVLEEFFA